MIPLSRPKVTDLPGAVGASYRIRASRSPKARNRVAVKPATAAQDVSTSVKHAVSAPSFAPAAPPAAPPPRHRRATGRAAAAPPAAPPAAPREDAHWAFARARVDLCDVHSRDVVLPASSKGLFVFPMVPDGEDTVYMRLKRIHPITGKLSYHWVVVYNGETAEHTVEQFAFE